MLVLALFRGLLGRGLGGGGGGSVSNGPAGGRGLGASKAPFSCFVT